MFGKEILEHSDNKEIQPKNFSEMVSGGLSKDDAVKFWHDEFDKMEMETEYSFSEDELRQMTRDCTEEQFRFDFAISDEMKDILAEFDEADWQELELSEQEALVTKYAEQIGKELGIEEIPKIDFYDGPEGDYGCYMERYNAIRINQNTIDDVKELIDTVPHEMRHAYQWQRADLFETDVDQAYKYSLEHYISPEYDDYGFCVNYFDYQDQLVEAEARAFAKLFSAQEVDE